jgi:hypothetical protein
MATTLNLPTLGFIIGTRVMFGIGVGLLIAGRLSADHRRRAGLALVSAGAATTVPAIAAVLRGRQPGRPVLAA